MQFITHPNASSTDRRHHLVARADAEPAWHPTARTLPSRGFRREHPSDSSNPLASAYDWGTAPEGLATRRQLRALGLRPAGQGPIILRCRTCGYWLGRTYLYRIDRAKPVRPMTLAQERALDRAMEARTRCPKCRRRYHHCLPLRTLGSCLECHDSTPANPSSYVKRVTPRPGGVTGLEFADLWPDEAPFSGRVAAHRQRAGRSFIFRDQERFQHALTAPHRGALARACTRHRRGTLRAAARPVEGGLG
ncbi:RRQRL motif-containing zinc-binding protein [Streptomyces mirabilis]|uniref:RRQRL motif-containing zinc-binding protein n=1 Tax=Streptomyces mirabilis TaxID=68239 RepID=UPI0036A8C8FB